MGSQDGADLGFTAEQGMKAAIAGEQPDEKTAMDPVAFEKFIMSQEGPSDYSGTAAYAAKLLLVYIKAHPEAAQWDERRLWDDIIKVDPKAYKDLEGISGFMWGWAVNAARRCCELPPVRNPAIITIGGEEDNG